MAKPVDELHDRLRYDTPFWARHCAVIRDARNRKVPLVARPWQARTPATPARVTPLDEALERQRLAGAPQRVLILKARKLGMSTWVQAKFLQRVTMFENEYALSVAHRRDAGGQLYDMARRMYDHLPSDAQLAELVYGAGTELRAPFTVRPPLIGEINMRQGNRGMVVGHKLRRTDASVYETLTAGAKGGGRASTPSALHGSEVAHYEDPLFLVGALNAVPKEANTIVVLETTANGFNHFHARWVRAVDGVEDPDTGGLYAPLFYGWQDNPFNATAFVSDQARDRFERTIGDPDGGGDDEEPWLIESFGTSLEQLRWRRLTRDEECGGDVEQFHQEHPATAEQAFIGSGRPVFPGIRVAKMLRAADDAPAPVEGVLRGIDWKTKQTRAGTVRSPQRALWVPPALATAEDVDVWGLDHRVLVWEHPVNAATQAEIPEAERRPDGQYVAFADVAEGVEQDYHAVQVLDHVTRTQVARYRSRIPIHDLPILLVLIGLYYNEALLAVEKNSLGVGVVDALAKDYRYRYLYRARRPGDDPREDAAGRRVGWETTPRTKPLMEQTFGEILKTGEHGLRDVATGREFTTYVEDERNPAKHGAQPGAHDDLAMAFMGAHRVAAEYVPRRTDRQAVRRHRRPRDPFTGY